MISENAFLLTGIIGFAQEVIESGGGNTSIFMCPGEHPIAKGCRIGQQWGLGDRESPARGYGPVLRIGGI